MRAVLATSPHPEDPLAGLAVEDRPDPEAPEGWEVVRVVAAALNHHDLWTLRGVGIDPARLPIVLGCDAAGVASDGRPVVVHAVIGTRDPSAGVNDETLAPDFSLLSERYDGTMATFVAVPSRNLVTKPGELTFDEAACLPTAYLTAYRALFGRGRAELKAGDTVLVQGAGGGVATAATILGRAAGLRVWLTSRSPERAERAQHLGADAVFPSGARLPERVQAVLDTVGEATWSHSLKALVPGGTLVTVGATSGPNPPADLQRIFYRQLRVVGSTMGTREDLEAVIALLVRTGARPLVDSVVPLEDARVSFARMAAGDVFGKCILRVTKPS